MKIKFYIFQSLSVFLFIIFAVGCQTTPKPLEAKNAGTPRGQWQTSIPTQNNFVVLIPQRHYLPTFDSRKSPQPMPQDLNQMAIFEQTSEWIQDNSLTNYIIEGCEGDLNFENPLEFNGWSLKSLHSEKSIDKIQTHVGFKLKVKYENEAHVACGDNLALIQEHQLALSDLQGLAGFKIRLSQKTLSPRDREKYLVGIRQILKLAKEKDEKILMGRLDEEIKKSQNRFYDLISQRNDRFVEAALKTSGRKAIVIGALHIQDLKNKLEKQNQTVGIWSPQGLGDMSEDPISQLNQQLGLTPTQEAH